MPLRDFLAGYQHNPETFDYASFAADVLREHEQDASVLTAKINDSDTRLTALGNDLNAQKLRNYELLTKIPSDGKNPVTDRQELNEEADISIEDLFGNRERADA